MTEPICPSLRFSAWWIYAAAWIPFGGFYAMALKTTNTLPLERALIAGGLYAIPPALFGVAIWRLSGLLMARKARVVTIVAVHTLGAVVSTTAWLFIEIAQIASQAGWDTAVAASHAFAGFQLLDGTFIYGVLAVGSHVIRIAARLREEEARAARSDALRMRAELAALRGQLNPHFLFNTLPPLTATVA